MESKEWDVVAKSYHDQVVSPFHGDVDNPLLQELKKIKNKKNKKIAEFGCGFFYLGELLSKEFKNVHASDFSSEMVKKAKEKNKHLKNVVIKKEDLRNLPYNNEFDIIISVNALIMPSYKDIRTSFKNLSKALKDNGTLFLILPSMEAVLYHGMLLMHNELDGRKEDRAEVIAKTKFEKNKYDLLLGKYNDGGEVQKFYYKHEIGFLLKKSGLKKGIYKKVKYPWDKDISDYEPFPEEDRIWDWFVAAKKTG